jgi:peptide chain release factor subunit 3
MDPTAAEFIPSWLPRSRVDPAAESAAAEAAAEAAAGAAAAAPDTTGAAGGAAPASAVAEAPSPPEHGGASGSEPPDAWDDEEETPPAAGVAGLSVNGDAASRDAVKARSADAKDSEPPPAGAKPPAPGPSRAKDACAGKASGSSDEPPAMLSGPTEGADAKKPLSVVLLGHVDAGKSTISGNILVLTGNVDERTMEKYEKEAKALNRESWKFAFALDSSEQERAKGKTEEYGQAAFATETRRFTILDAPGHKVRVARHSRAHAALSGALLASG